MVSRNDPLTPVLRRLHAFWDSTRMSPEHREFVQFQARRYPAILEILRPLGRWDGKTVLDLGGGSGSFAVAFSAAFGGNVDVADRIDPGESWRATEGQYGVRHRFVIHLDSVESLRSLDRPYDLVLLIEVLEHLLVNALSLLQEIRALLSPGGILLLTTPNQARLRNRFRLLRGASIREANPYGSPDARTYGHVMEFSLPDLLDLLQRSRFSVTTTRVVQNPPSGAATAFRRVGAGLVQAASRSGASLGDNILVVARRQDG